MTGQGRVMLVLEPERAADNYVRGMAWLREQGQLPATGVYETTVKHDDWCALLAGVGPCNCRAEIWHRGRRLHVPNHVYHGRTRRG